MGERPRRGLTILYVDWTRRVDTGKTLDAADRVEQEIQRAVVMLPTIRGSVISDAI